MNPKDASSWMSQWQTRMQNHKEALAQQYIENNIELLETDVDEFIDNCSLEYVSEVVAILKAADIDVSDAIQRIEEADITLKEISRANEIYLRDVFGMPQWREPKTSYWNEKWVSYDLSGEEDYTWKGDKWRVKGTV